MKIDNGISVTLRMPAELVGRLKQQARKIAYDTSVETQYTDLIRRAVEAAYPASSELTNGPEMQACGADDPRAFAAR